MTNYRPVKWLSKKLLLYGSLIGRLDVSLFIIFEYYVHIRDRDWFMNHVGDMLGKHFELTFHALCPSKSPPIFGHFLNPFEVYDDLNDPAALRK